MERVYGGEGTKGEWLKKCYIDKQVWLRKENFFFIIIFNNS
ncbi:hypothetical protein MSP8887_04128 [Marinomonas spartinae]|uniref:Uncharacterized protein n=1 Tax=Marinomonas spartinae TaxID=1792290 RepID=A0A1A8T5D5_9GAMM|nr:hypothetical protein MSP8886_00523 [Marinomonas spartinae]SBS40010.1 hypothetical protein MSP8887_04128 [Marinomonas spartinae]